MPFPHRSDGCRASDTRPPRPTQDKANCSENGALFGRADPVGIVAHEYQYLCGRKAHVFYFEELFTLYRS